MRFLKLLLLILLALALAWFAALNWVPVTVRLWAPYELVIRLPVLIVAAVLLGWLPSALAHSLNRWRWRRKLTRTERELEARRTAAAEPAVSTVATDVVPPQAQPIVVPPAGA
jgi:lipopolysaccharide assembly protein A